ncbi:hypothetical protein RND81_09G236800 [Saponaria officinalis]|uniref:Uncharacterized protein n=1 Tax=Saponaria officinalis TaxID=3572 RepID=A0AAW1IQM9_SAPOF
MVAPPGPPPSGDSARFSGGSFSESEDIYMTINTDRDAEFYGVDPPRVNMLTKEPSQNERQISVDPISLQETATIRQASFRLVSPKAGFGPSNPVPSPPSKLKFVSTSLPSSASSSPHSTSLMKKIWKGHNGHNKPVTSKSNLSRMPSTMDDTHLAMIEANQRRSRSLGEGRRSSTHMDDLDLWLEKSNRNKTKNKNNDKNSKTSYSKPPLGPSAGDRLSEMKSSKSRGDQSYPEDGFKCGKLCLFLPRGKGKPVRSISTVSTEVSSHTDPPTISRTVSLERFECGSWGSSLHEDADGDSTNLFFDLPMEMLRCSVSDMQSAVTAAFVFDNENDNNKKDQEEFNAFLEAQG